ncbi:hypothetical protein [Cryobacterium sp. Y82]|uniref:hypothetical protein n=1 Tax=Cryobacterium sp. Y82 TaxID=2045017 RepID=UPI000CE36BC4|nr:hypothetical protein [Cryobacterium sp. Y82]
MEVASHQGSKSHGSHLRHLVLAGFACGILAVLHLVWANLAVPLPLFTSPPSRPRASVLLNVDAVALVIWGATS